MIGLVGATSYPSPEKLGLLTVGIGYSEGSGSPFTAPFQMPISLSSGDATSLPN